MNERSELAERLEQVRVCYWVVDDPAGIYLYSYERDMIIAALREHEAIERLREELATCHELRTFDAVNINILRNTIKNCPPVSESEYVRRLESEYEAVAALRAPALPSEEQIVDFFHEHERLTFPQQARALLALLARSKGCT